MSSHPSFIERAVSGEVPPNGLEQGVEAEVQRWHESPENGIPLHEFLGMTWEEYARFAESPDALPDIVNARAAARRRPARGIHPARSDLWRYVAAALIGAALASVVLLLRDSADSTSPISPDQRAGVDDCSPGEEYQRCPCADGATGLRACGEMRRYEGDCNCSVEAPAVSAASAVVPDGCGAPPAYLFGPGQLRLATSRTDAEAKTRWKNVSTTLKQWKREEYLRYLAIQQGSIGGKKVPVLVINNVDSATGASLCTWLECKGWSPGEFTCAMRSHAAPPPEEN